MEDGWNDYNAPFIPFGSVIDLFADYLKKSAF